MGREIVGGLGRAGPLRPEDSGGLGRAGPLLSRNLAGPRIYNPALSYVDLPLQSWKKQLIKTIFSSGEGLKSRYIYQLK